MKNITVNATINNVSENELNILNLMFGDRIRFIPDEKKAAPEKKVTEKKATQKTTKKTSDNTKTAETKKQTAKKVENQEVNTTAEKNNTALKASIYRTCREETTKECVATGKWVKKAEWLEKYNKKVDKAMTAAGFKKVNNKWV